MSADSANESRLQEPPGPDGFVQTFHGVAHQWLCDHMGHLNTRHISAMFDDGGMHLMRQLGYDWSAIDNTKVGLVNVRDVVEYLREVPAGQLIEIFGQLRRVGTKSLTTYQEMRSSNTGAVHARQESTIVCFDLRTRASVPVPDIWRQTLESKLPVDSEEPQGTTRTDADLAPRKPDVKKPQDKEKRFNE